MLERFPKNSNLKFSRTMSLYLLSYDLRNKRDYKTLYGELASFKAISVLESDWCFKRTNTSASDLRDHFKKFIDGDDRLFVAEIDDWAGRLLIESPNKLP